MEITVGSLFDGIGGWCIAAERNGAVPVWSSEIEPFCMEVTKKHFPNVMQLGDIRKIKGDKIPPVDIICAGSPCQDLSVAGKREGLKGERSGLFRTANDVVSDMLRATKGEYPKYFVWENYLEHFQATKGVTFKPCLAKSHKSIFQCLSLEDGQEAEWYEAKDVTSHGASLTLNIGAFPSIERESSLLRVLEIRGVDRKYYLSPKACQGILRRAKARKKRLPELLYRVLKHQSMTSEMDK